MNKAWAVFFRIPNLPTSWGDTLAGALFAFALAQAGSDSFPPAIPVLLLGAAESFLYLFGLADNDIVGFAKNDRIEAPHRPLPSGGIRIGAARRARLCCLILALLCATAFQFFFLGLKLWRWPVSFFALVLSIVCYNRTKDKFQTFGVLLMGLCRGLAALCGGIAACDFMAASSVAAPPPLTPVALLGTGIATYICALTILANGEHRADSPIGAWRFALGATSLFPAAFALTAVAAFGKPIGTIAFFPVLFAFVALGRWIKAVQPLGRKHGPEERRAAVGAVVGNLIFLQSGFILSRPCSLSICAVAAAFAASLAIKKSLPNVSGS